MLTGKEHDKLWEITKEVLRAIVPEEQFAGTEKRIDGFRGGYGTVCFSAFIFLGDVFWVEYMWISGFGYPYLVF